MSAAKKKGHAVSQTLAKTRASHAKRLKKVEQTLASFEKQRHKLAALEAKLAVLARGYADTPPPANDPSNRRADKLGADKLERTHVIVNPKSKCLADGTISLETIVEELRSIGI